MKYISLFIVSILILLGSCSEVTVRGYGEGSGVLTAGFQDTVVTVFENIGIGTLQVNFSQALTNDTKIVLSVVAEENIQENKDYFLSAKEVTVKAGAKSITVEYSLIDDNISNDARSFTLKLVSVNGGVINTQNSMVQVKILDDESDVAVGFKDSEVVVQEREAGNSAASYLCQIPIEVLGNMQKPIQFKVAVHPIEAPNVAVSGIHFNLLESSFVVENTADVVTVPVEIMDDNIVNVNRVFALDIIEVVGAELYTIQKRCVITIENDDMGIYFGVARMTAEERDGKVKIPVKLTQSGDEDMSFVLSATGVAQEGTDYSLTKEWTIPAGKTEIEIEVDLNHVAGVQNDRVMTLGFASVGAGLAVFEEQPTCDLNILDVDTKLDFKYAEWGVTDMRGTLKIPVVLPEALAHDVSFKLNINPVDGADVTITAPEATIVAGKTSAVIEVKVNKLTAHSFTMNLANVKGATATELQAKVSQCGTIDGPQGLTIGGFSSQAAAGEPAGSGIATAAVDGDESTYWHSEWTPNDTQLPQYIIVKVPDHLHVSAVDVIRRISASNSDTKKAEIFLSTDMENWELQGTLEWTQSTGTDRAQHLRQQKFDHVQQGGYIKINVTEGFRHYGQVGQVIVYGYNENEYE